jgi:hypothetical protein
MDPGSLALLIPIVAIASTAVAKVAKVMTKARYPDQNPEIADRLAALEDEMATLRGELGEAHERLDFTERLLAQGKQDGGGT